MQGEAALPVPPKSHELVPVSTEVLYWSDVSSANPFPLHLLDLPRPATDRRDFQLWPRVRCIEFPETGAVRQPYCVANPEDQSCRQERVTFWHGASALEGRLDHYDHSRLLLGGEAVAVLVLDAL